MIYSRFYRHNSSCTVFWVSSFHLSVNIVVLYQFTVPGHVYRKLRIKSWSVKSLGWKKGSRLRLCFRVVDDVPEKKGMDLWKQMSSSKCSFTCICRIFLPLNPSTTTVYAWSAFYLGLRFTLSLQSAFYTQSAFYPWSAVCSPQSAVHSLRFTLTVFCFYLFWLFVCFLFILLLISSTDTNSDVHQNASNHYQITCCQCNYR